VSLYHLTSRRRGRVIEKADSCFFAGCETCETYRPPRTSHCRLCDNCVNHTDHHVRLLASLRPFSLARRRRRSLTSSYLTPSVAVHLPQQCRVFPPFGPCTPADLPPLHSASAAATTPPSSPSSSPPSSAPSTPSLSPPGILLVDTLSHRTARHGPADGTSQAALSSRSSASLFCALSLG
jgi:hypothetical protein